MAIAITKAKVKPQPVVKLDTVAEADPTELSLEELADRYGDLKDRTDAIMNNPLFGQLQLTEAELKKRLEAYEPDEIIQIKGHKFAVEAGACAKEPRKITNVQKVFDMLGAKLFCELVKLTVTDAEKYLTPEQFALVVNEPGFTKNRKITYKHIG